MKNNILFLHPGPIYHPDLPDVMDKYTMLSKHFRGLVLTKTSNEKFRSYKLGDFLFKGFISNKYGFVSKLLLFIFMLKEGMIWQHKKNQFNVIVCYDPLFTGLVGSLLKYFLGCKLIIEINSDILNAPFLDQASFLTKIKRNIYKAVVRFNLHKADKIKLLYSGQRNLIEDLVKEEKYVVFPDFTPTHYFNVKDSMENTAADDKYILFVGWPFFLKGVDILIKAFDKISAKFPNFSLKLIGYKLEQDAGKSIYVSNSKIKFVNAIPYDKLRSEFLNCYCFVLPSLSEGVPRVMMEAMASGKPVIGSRVGGVPEIIDDGKNGFLFKKGDINELASKLCILLSDANLAEEMGMTNRRLIGERFSSDVYTEHFSNMIFNTL